MKPTSLLIPRLVRTRFSRLRFAFYALIGAFLSSQLPAEVPIPQIESGEQLTKIVSGAATSVVEMVRSGAPGTVVEVTVKVGDLVKKGQSLGHTDIYSTKLNLDIAKANEEATGVLDQANAQLEASNVLRDQAASKVTQSKNKETNFQLEYAESQVKAAQAAYRSQMDSKEVKKIQLNYWKDEYSRRFFKAPVDGVVSEVRVKPGEGVVFATHVFTIRGEGDYSILVSVPAALADTALALGGLKVLPHGGKSLINAAVDSASDDPSAVGEKKILKLFIKGSDMAGPNNPKPDGTKFDVFIPD